MSWDDCCFANWEDCKFVDTVDNEWDFHEVTHHGGPQRDGRRAAGRGIITGAPTRIASREISYLDMMREDPDSSFLGGTATFKKPYRAGEKTKPEYVEYKGGEESVLGAGGAGDGSGAGAGGREAEWRWVSRFDTSCWNSVNPLYGDDTYWQAGENCERFSNFGWLLSAPGGDPSNWSGNIDIKAGASWATDFRPSFMLLNRLSFDYYAFREYSITDSDGNVIGSQSVKPYSILDAEYLTKIPLDFDGCGDIATLNVTHEYDESSFLYDNGMFFVNNTSWNSSKLQWSTVVLDALILVAVGNWNKEFRPKKMRITLTGDPKIYVELYRFGRDGMSCDAPEHLVVYDTYVSSREEIDINGLDTDIFMLLLWPGEDTAQVEDIEFLALA